MKTFALLLMACGLGFAQMETPRLGFVRCPDHTLRELRGVAGSFQIGPVVLEGVDAFSFNGQRGGARTSDATVPLGEAGEGEIEGTDTIAALDGNAVVLLETGVRLDLPHPVTTIERAGAEYLLLSGDAGQVLVRFKRGAEAVYYLPEAAQ